MMNYRGGFISLAIFGSLFVGSCFGGPNQDRMETVKDCKPTNMEALAVSVGMEKLDKDYSWCINEIEEWVKMYEELEAECREHKDLR